MNVNSIYDQIDIMEIDFDLSELNLEFSETEFSDLEVDE